MASFIPKNAAFKGANAIVINPDTTLPSASKPFVASLTFSTTSTTTPTTSDKTIDMVFITVLTASDAF